MKDYKKEAKQLLQDLRKFETLEDKLLINYISKDLIQAHINGKIDELNRLSKRGEK